MLIEESIEILTRMYLEEKFLEKDETKYIIDKKDLIKFCIKLLKEIDRHKEIEEIKAYEDKIYI